MGHFVSKCPFEKTEDTIEDKRRTSRKGKENKFQRRGKVGDKRKSPYSREDSSFDEEDSDTDIDFEPYELLFMALDNHNEVLEQG